MRSRYRVIHIETDDGGHQKAIQEKLDALPESAEIYSIDHSIAKTTGYPMVESTVIVYREYL